MNWTTREEWEKHNERPHIREVAKHKDELFALEPQIRQMTMVGGR